MNEYELIILGVKLDGLLQKVEQTIRKDARILIIRDMDTRKIVNQICKVGAIDNNDIMHGVTSVIEDKKELCDELDIHIQDEDWPVGRLPEHIYGDFRIRSEDSEMLLKEFQKMSIEVWQQVTADREFIRRFGMLLEGQLNEYECLDFQVLRKAVVQALVNYNREQEGRSKK